MAHRYEIYRDKAGEFRVRFKYNSEVMWASEGYSSKVSAQNLIDSLKSNVPSAPVEDLTRPC
ncbi:YegP family protein [Nitratireductor luteus]|uniref:YegP family protein n=1 Tax=Nitratireductor luteus TaxID=2976980 RepID=UPI00223FB4C1